MPRMNGGCLLPGRIAHVPFWEAVGPPREEPRGGQDRIEQTRWSGTSRGKLKKVQLRYPAW